MLQVKARIQFITFRSQVFYYMQSTSDKCLFQDQCTMELYAPGVENNSSMRRIESVCTVFASLLSFITRVSCFQWYLPRKTAF